MKLSFNKSSKSIITSYINKANYSQSQKEIKYNNSTKNLGKEIINLNYKTKRNVNTISPLKNNSFYKQPNTLFLQFHNNKLKKYHSLNNFNNNNTNTKFSTTALTEKKYLKKTESNRTIQSLNKLSFKDKKLIKETTLNIIKKYNSEEKVKSNKLNIRKGSSTISYLYYKDNHPKKRNKLNFKRINYPLNELMKLDPYHYLSKGVKDSINKFMNINKKDFNYPNLKNGIKTSNGNSVKSLYSNTILLKKSNKKIYLLKKLLKIYETIPYDDLKYCIKWEGINHIWQKHIVLINFLLNNYHSYKWFINENEFINCEKLKDFFKICLHVNSFDVNCNCFIDDIFLLFSSDKIHTNIKKLFCTFIITNNTIVYNDKINTLIEVWLNESNNSINIKNMYFYIKNNLRIKSDYKKIVAFFKNIIKKNKFNIKIFNKDDIYKYYTENNELRRIFEKNCNINYKKIEEDYNETVTKYYAINSNGCNFGVTNQYVRVFSPIMNRRFNDLLENIDRINEKKQNIYDLLENENYNSS